MGRGLSLSVPGRPLPRAPWASQVPPVARRPGGPALSGIGAGTGGTGGDSQSSAPGSCPRCFTPAAFCPSTLTGTAFSDPTLLQPLAHPTRPCYLMSPFTLVIIKPGQHWMRSAGGCGDLRRDTAAALAESLPLSTRRRLHGPTAPTSGSQRPVGCAPRPCPGREPTRFPPKGLANYGWGSPSQAGNRTGCVQSRAAANSC